VADPYIDPFETKLYGKFAREQMSAVCLGKVPELDGMIEFAVLRQEEADKTMSDLLAKQPKAPPPLDANEVLEEASDTLIRFGKHIESLKGRPVDPRDFFRGDAPSVLARRRLTKLAAGVAHVLAELKRQKAKIRDADHWIADLKQVHGKLEVLEKQQRASKVEKLELGPEVSAGRERWLSVYNANKLFVRGLLAHLGKPELLPLIFDDLAEIHRVSGVSDALPTGGTPDESPEPAPAPPTS
jgi:hypothetical protein